MEDTGRAGETNSGQITEGEEDEEQEDTGETGGEENGVPGHVPVRRREGGESREVSIPMEDYEGGEDEDVVNQELQRRLYARCAVRTVFKLASNIDISD